MTKSSYKKDEENQKEDERKRSIMKERERETSYSNLVVNWLNGRRNMNNQKIRAEVQNTQKLFDERDIRPTSGHLDLFQHGKLIVSHTTRWKRHPVGNRSR